MSNLSDLFSSMTYEDWLQLAGRELNGSVTREWDGMEIPKYFTRENSAAQLTAFANYPGNAERGAGDTRSWDNVTFINKENVRHANSQALNDLMYGADGVLFQYSEDHKCTDLLADILPDYAALMFSGIDFEFASEYRAWLDHQDADHQAVRGYLSGENITNNPEYFRLFHDYPNIRFIHFNLEAEPSSESLQLSEFLSALTDCIDQLGAKGISIRDIWKRLVVSVACGPLFFEEIIRMRALRILCYKIFRAYGLDRITPGQVYIHGISPAWTKESLQPHANMLKGCTTGLAAVLGGCQQVSILPEDPDSDLQQRIARNVSLILREECYLNKVLDVCAGSHYIESLTEKLARRTWDEFRLREKP